MLIHGYLYFRLMIISARINTSMTKVLIRMQGFATAFRTNAIKKFLSLIQPLLQIQDLVQAQQQLVKPVAPPPVPTVPHLASFLDFQYFI